MVFPDLEGISSRMDSSRFSGSGFISQAAISLRVAPWKHSSQMPSRPPALRTGGPKTRQVIGRYSYKSHVPVFGSSAGHGSSLAKLSNASCACSSSARIPVSGSPGNSAIVRATYARARAWTCSARGASFRRSASNPSCSRAASSSLIANAPTQHWVQPGRQTSHFPAFLAASARAASTIWTNSRSRTGRAELMRSEYAGFVTLAVNRKPDADCADGMRINAER